MTDDRQDTTEPAPETGTTLSPEHWDWINQFCAAPTSGPGAPAPPPPDIQPPSDRATPGTEAAQPSTPEPTTAGTEAQTAPPPSDIQPPPDQAIPGTEAAQLQETAQESAAAGTETQTAPTGADGAAYPPPGQIGPPPPAPEPSADQGQPGPDPVPSLDNLPPGSVTVPPPTQDATPATTGDGAKVTIPLKSPPVVCVEFKVPTRWVDFGVKLSAKVSGTVEIGSGSTNVSPIGYDDGAITARVAHSWYAKDNTLGPALTALFNEVEVAGQAKVKDGIELSFAVSGKVNGATVKFQLTVAKFDSGKSATKFMSGTGKVEFDPMPITLDDNLGVKLDKLEVQPSAEISAQPNWTTIALDWAGEAAVTEGTGTAATATVTGVELATAVAGMAVVASVSTILGAANALWSAWAIEDLAHSRDAALAGVSQGFLAAMQGGGDPGGFAAAGWAAGKANYDAFTAQLRASYPTATDDAIRAAIAGKAGEALEQVKPSLYRGALVALWDGYLRNNTFALLPFTAAQAYAACFGDTIDVSNTTDPQWAKYRKQHPKLS